jgi:hypothetical protein
MNTFTRTTLTAFVLGLTLSSCEKDNLPKPTTQVEPQSKARLATTYKKMTKYGPWQLSYNSHGQVSKLVSTLTPGLIREYNWGSNGKTLGIQESQNGTWLKKTIMTFNVHGYCEEAWIKTFSIATFEQHYKYDYDAKYRLYAIRDQDSNARYEFSYDPSSIYTITKITALSGNVKKWYTTFEYQSGNFVSAVPTADHRAWPKGDLMDEFISIYGGLAGKLVSSYKTYRYLPNSNQVELLDAPQFKYTLDNTQPYILKREDTKKLFGQTVKEVYDYGYSDILINP